MSSNYRTKYHRDGTVTVRDAYRQKWARRDAGSVLADDCVMSSLGEGERARIEAMAHGMTLAQARNLARRLVRAANDEGTVQAADMLDLAGRRDPTLHTTASIACAARALGCY
ncbi:MAG TPA: hypothetical protein VG894_03130, partial [Bauldia sp.]|nr:hypothetical protein [Bauldia sp.]